MIDPNLRLGDQEGKAIVPIPLQQSVIHGVTVETVNARDIHDFLGVGKDFTTWIKARIDQYGFESGRDYIRLVPPDRGTNGRGGDRRSVEYHVTLDMAKELAMVERNEQGKVARRYFIECERRLIANRERMFREMVGGLSDTDMRAIGGMVKGIVNKALGDLVDERIEAKLMEDRRRAVGEYVAALDIAKKEGVPAKRRRGLCQSISARLRRFSNARGYPVRQSAETSRWLFHVDAVNAWMADYGRGVIKDHMDRLSGQTRLNLKPIDGGRA